MPFCGTLWAVLTGAKGCVDWVPIAVLLVGSIVRGFTDCRFDSGNRKRANTEAQEGIIFITLIASVIGNTSYNSNNIKGHEVPARIDCG
jgi:hypothetical protein